MPHILREAVCGPPNETRALLSVASASFRLAPRAEGEGHGPQRDASPPRVHREAEATRDIHAILETSFPDLAPEDEGIAFNDDVIVVLGTVRGTSRGDWLGIYPPLQM